MYGRTIYFMIIPKQEATSSSCQARNEEEIFAIQDEHSLFSLGWIHTHPSQTCFMSSIDLHTQFSYQVMLPEAIAVVMAPTDPSRNYGIFRLSNPGGISVIRECDERGFILIENHQMGVPFMRSAPMSISTQISGWKILIYADSRTT